LVLPPQELKLMNQDPASCMANQEIKEKKRKVEDNDK
jgi:hypothetical protein